MIKKIQVLVREVYESEKTEEVIAHRQTGEKISNWDYKSLTDEEKAQYTHNEVSTGMSQIEVAEGDPLYGQIFTEEQFDMKDLILHLNRTR